ncbi:MFS transporter [Anaerobacillus sp. CMMVII]|uniref:MFS transporter n=1 Tax=Anaerobacillus sp. CMMVII TaxID=2755588 RepID=UPI0021C4F983|nr:MFS transporter [Anaerobacillus sp. CMMVII]MCT8139000.1 MFS transporter [Anaerobacillus sp. CMMVII]
MWIANFLVAASATMILPFLSLYISTFGEFSSTYVQKWSGLVFGITFLAAFLISPLWGRFGDKHGRKKILLITGFGIAVSIFLMGYASSVTELFILRLFMGVVTGFIPTAVALISAQTDKKHAGKVLATVQTGTVSGGLFGPLIGGALVDAVGFQYTFVLTSSVIALATFIVAIGIKEVTINEKVKGKKSYSRKEVFRLVFQSKLLLAVMIISFLIQTANFSIQPLLALYVDELTVTANLAFMAGLAFSITGLGNLLSTRSWGNLGDRIGHGKVLIICMILAVIFFIPQAFVTNIWQLVALRFLYGLQVGGLIPCMTAYIRQLAPLSIQGEVLGYNQSFRFLGNVVGPVLGGIISGFLGISSVFYFSASLFLVGLFILWYALKAEEVTSVEEQHKLKKVKDL